MESAADGFQGLNSMTDLLQRQSVNTTNCSCCQGIVYHMTARHWDICRERLLTYVNAAGHAFHDLIRINILI